MYDGFALKKDITRMYFAYQTMFGFQTIVLSQNPADMYTYSDLR